VNAASADKNAAFESLNARSSCPIFSNLAARSTRSTAWYIESPTASLITMLLISLRSCDKDYNSQKKKKCPLASVTIQHTVAYAVENKIRQAHSKRRQPCA